MTADPIGLAGGVNLYVYVMGNPLNRTDPYGLIINQIIQTASGAGTFYLGLTIAAATVSTPVFVGAAILAGLGAGGMALGLRDLLQEVIFGESLSNNAGYLTFVGETIGGETGRVCGLAGDTIVDFYGVKRGLFPLEKTVFNITTTAAGGISLKNDFVDIAAEAKKRR